MNTYYYDTDQGNDARLWSDIVSQTIVKLQIPVGQREFNPAPHDGIVFIHHSSLACTDAAANELTAKYPSAIFVWIFGGGLRDAPVGARYYSVRSVVHKPGDSAFKERVADFLEDYERSKTPTFSLLEPLNREPLLALRLLCEAWKFTGGAKQKEDVHAPSSAAEWFEPFSSTAPTGPKPPVDQSEEESKRFDDELNRLAGRMGDAEVEAKALLKACITENGPTDLLVKDFLKMVRP